VGQLAPHTEALNTACRSPLGKQTSTHKIIRLVLVWGNATRSRIRLQCRKTLCCQATKSTIRLQCRKTLCCQATKSTIRLQCRQHWTARQPNQQSGYSADNNGLPGNQINNPATVLLLRYYLDHPTVMSRSVPPYKRICNVAFHL
jgi:hypothetical protein